MLRRILTICQIYRSDKLCVRAEFLAHADVLAPHRAMCYRRAASLGDRSRCANSYCAVDDRQDRLEKFNVSDCLAYKVLYLEWIADMKDIDRSDVSDWRSNIDSQSIVML